ncbi:protein kinase-like domain-containing protein [Artemisia annua]|uniref:Protein kinase-like domain-containing protein n=1 Tax=Artemisia annua TaxID=35608 RepID=A0A2U1MI65_ARTAN|nr:protein kinase-like domain-containing protein [Artemisia annua]
MSSSTQNLDHLKIPLEDILEATNNFSNENFIRQGGFGKIFKGRLKRSGIDIVARSLDTKYGQGSKEFWTEISMLSELEHENLVSLVGFCDEKNMKIVVNKYEAKGSLDNYLDDPSSLTWLQRLQICLRVARALNYIHYEEKRDFSVIHRNIKSSKILLDDNFVPKLAGFNLSMTTVASRRGRLCIDDPCGSAGYVDPTYAKTGSVTHKSDIYAFGVILFEVLFGMKAITNNRDIKLANLAKSGYENEQLDNWILSGLRTQMAFESLKIFSDTAYDCLKEHRAGRPSIHTVVMKLEKALKIQRYKEDKARKEEKEAYIRVLRRNMNKKSSKAANVLSEIFDSKGRRQLLVAEYRRLKRNPIYAHSKGHPPTGSFAAALIGNQLDCWVMNVVPVSGPNTLPVIYDRGLLGVMHDWCEPFDTYPRTYDLLHAAGLFSIERKRCNITSIMLEMDRILRPGGRVYIRDSISVMDELEEIGKAIGWRVAGRKWEHLNFEVSEIRLATDNFADRYLQAHNDC